MKANIISGEKLPGAKEAPGIELVAENIKDEAAIDLIAEVRDIYPIDKQPKRIVIDVRIIRAQRRQGKQRSPAKLELLF